MSEKIVKARLEITPFPMRKSCSSMAPTSLFCILFNMFISYLIKNKNKKWITSTDNVIRKRQEKELQCNEVICKENSALFQDEDFRG